MSPAPLAPLVSAPRRRPTHRPAQSLLARVARAGGLTALLAAPALAGDTFVAFLPGSFIDISTTGSQITPSTNGEFSFQSTIGNSHCPAGTVRIGVNGAVRFGPPSVGLPELEPVNKQLPDSGAFGGALALLPYWDAFNAGNVVTTFGSIQRQELNGQLIIQWTDMRLASAGSQDRVTFQVQIPANGDVFARFVYSDISAGSANGGAGATIGYQGATQADTAQFSCNAPMAVHDGMVLSLIDDRTQAVIVGAEGTFIDIAGVGVALPLGNDDSTQFSTSIRNAFVTEAQLAIGSNGGIRLNGANSTLAPNNTTIPSSTVFGGGRTLLPFWDDLNPSGGVFGAVYVAEFADRLIVQWDNVTFTGASLLNRATFQVVLFDQSELLAQFLYRDIEGARAASGSSATIGFQDSGAGHLPFSFHSASVSNGAVISFIRRGAQGASFCAATPNSTTRPARVSAHGNDRISQDNCFLAVESLPLNATAFFLVSPSTAFVPHAGGSLGTLCLGGAIGRGVGGVGNSGSTGTLSRAVPLLAIPSPTGPFAVQPGDTLSFQCWYRDAVGGAAVSNYSDAVQLQFEP
ncbi:MAG: hypothetical protein R3F49_18860 [Planctomycetota bacterium]